MNRTYIAIRRSVVCTLLAALFVGAALAQEPTPLIIVTSVVAGHENNTPELTCVQTSRFQHEEQIVWRAKIIDPGTGEEMADDVLEYVRVILPDGQTFDMGFGPHPSRDPVDEYWTLDWVIPADYPSGVLDYDIVAVALDGRTGKNVVFPIESSMLTILPE